MPNQQPSTPGPIAMTIFFKFGLGLFDIEILEAIIWYFSCLYGNNRN